MKSTYLKKYRIPLLLGLIVFGATVIRVAYVNLLLNEHNIKDFPIHADSRQYVKYGYNLAEHKTFSIEFPSPNPIPDSFRSPGYPLVIAISMGLTNGTQFIPVVLYSQVMLGSTIVLLTYLLATRCLPGWGALIAAGLVAISPHLVAMSGYILSETLFSFFLLSAILCYIVALERNRYVYFGIAGVFFGCAFLTNETVLILPLFVTLMTFACYQKSIDSAVSQNLISKLVLFLTVFLVFPFSWNLRNIIVIPSDAPRAADRAIQTLSHGAYPGFIHKDPAYKYYPYLEDSRQPQFGESLKNFSDIFIERFREDPLRYIRWYFFQKPYYFWSWDILQGQGDIYVYPLKTSLYQKVPLIDLTRLTMKTLHIWLLLLSAACFFVLVAIQAGNAQDRIFVQTPLLLLVTCLYYTLLYSIFAPWPRYSVPLRPQLYICAMWTLCWLVSRFKQPIARVIKAESWQ